MELEFSSLAQNNPGWDNMSSIIQTEWMDLGRSVLSLALTKSNMTDQWVVFHKSGDKHKSILLVMSVKYPANRARHLKRAFEKYWLVWRDCNKYKIGLFWKNSLKVLTFPPKNEQRKRAPHALILATEHLCLLCFVISI